MEGFFKSSQLFDNTNHLSSIAHLRKIVFVVLNLASRMIGGRGLNNSKFGKTCPTQTPEGKKIGFTEHLSIYTIVDEETGFFKTPYHPVTNGVASSEIKYLSAIDENGKVIGHKFDYEKIVIDNKEVFVPKDEYLIGRFGEKVDFFFKESINFIDVAPNQIFSISASTNPFIGYNDPIELFQQQI